MGYSSIRTICSTISTTIFTIIRSLMVRAAVGVRLFTLAEEAGACLEAGNSMGLPAACGWVGHSLWMDGGYAATRGNVHFRSQTSESRARISGMHSIARERTHTCTRSAEYGRGQGEK